MKIKNKDKYSDKLEKDTEFLYRKFNKLLYLIDEEDERIELDRALTTVLNYGYELAERIRDK